MHTVNQLYARALLQYAADADLNIPASLQDAVGEHSRLPLTLLDQLWDACCRNSPDPLAGLRIGLNLQPGHLDSAGLLLMTCGTLGEALEQLVDVAPIVGGGGDFTLSHEGSQAVIRYQPNLATRQAERVEAVLAGILSLGRWASGGRFTASELRFAHKPLGPRASYVSLLATRVCFQAADCALSFPGSQMDLPLIQANASLRDYLHELTDRTLAELGCQSLSAETQRLIQRFPRWGKERIAAQMGISGRHLNRRLASEGCSFKTLRDSTLHRLALTQLQGHDKLDDIAVALGFSDESAFAKAFKRWTGTTPSQSRRALSSTERTD